MANRVFRIFIAGLVVGTGFVGGGGPKIVAADKPPAREIFVPFEELNVLLEGSTRRVLMSRTEYDELIKQARKTPDDKKPLEAALLAADYAATIENLRARITAKLTCEVLADGLHVLPLPLEGVGVLDASLDGKA